MDVTELAEPSSHFFLSQRQRLHYVDWGNPSAPTLVLLHGGRDHCRNWDWIATELRRDWHVIALDLRGHGDSAWSSDGAYTMASFVYDLAELIHQQDCGPVPIVAHSLGGNIALRYAGIYPENVSRIVAIEGLGPSPALVAERMAVPLAGHMRQWIEHRRTISGRQPRRYPSFEAALTRMKEENVHLSDARARHLTRHGLIRNEDGSYRWKFDNYVRSFTPTDVRLTQPHDLWERILCPTLLIYGADSWASNPAVDGRLKHFPNARVVVIEGAGHWVHHDRQDAFLDELCPFLMGERDLDMEEKKA
jgi:pimeloyl-ACP methyl ester carboxylesterase